MMTNCMYLMEDHYDQIMKVIMSSSALETGLMLYGGYDESNNPVLFRLVNPRQNASRTPSSFKIEREYAVSVTKEMERIGYHYLGSCHKHLGYDGPSKGDDFEAYKFLRANRHKSSVVSIVVDLYDSVNYDVYVVSYRINKGVLVKKYLNLTKLSETDFDTKFGQFNSTAPLMKKIAKKIENELDVSCTIRDKNLSREYVIYIPAIHRLASQSVSKDFKEDDNTGYRYLYSTKAELPIFIYLSIPYSSISSPFESKEKIMVGISSKDFSFDICVCQFNFENIFEPSIILKVLEKIIENIDKYALMPLRQFLLKGAY